MCLLIGTLGLGGAEKQVALLARGLHERGVAVHVVTLGGTGPHERLLADAGVPVTDLGVRWFRTRRLLCVLAPLIAAIRLARFVRTQRPEVLHAFLYWSYVIAFIATFRCRIPVLVAGRRSLGDSRRLLLPFLIAERLATRRARLLIANAEAVARATLDRERVAPSKVKVVYNGLPAAAFTRGEPFPLGACAGPVVVCVANLKAYKGHRYLIEAAGRLRERGRPITLVLVGDGEERAGLEAMAERLAIDVRFMGSRTDVPDFLARADLAVLPSLTEGMSNAVMEAMAAGLPIVATDVGGTAELIRGRGVLVPPGDGQALADALESLLDNPSRAAELARLALEFAREHLTEDAMVERHIEIYQELVER